MSMRSSGVDMMRGSLNSLLVSNQRLVWTSVMGVDSFRDIIIAIQVFEDLSDILSKGVGKYEIF
jgi:hypothetical protein